MFLPVIGSNVEIVRPSYWQQVKNFIAESSVGRWLRDGMILDPVGRKRLQSVASSSLTGLKRGVLVGGTVGSIYGLSRTNQSSENYALGLMAAGLGALAYNVMSEVFNEYNKGFLSQADAIAQIKELINKKLLNKCRTNQEKRELLANRDFFIEEFKKAGKTDKELESQKKLIDQAFDELKIEINN